MMAAMGDDFLDVRTHGFARVAVAVPEVRVADPAFNAEAHLRLLERVHREGAHYVLCPELGLSGYSCADLFFQEALLAAALAALGRVAEATAEWNLIVSVGLPLVVDRLLFHCAVTLFRGRAVAVAPKAFPPNYREFYERRWFHPAAHARAREITLLGERVPFGTDVLIAAPHLPGFVLHTDICEDLWTPVPPGTLAALAGATVLANLSASNVTVGKREYRQELVRSSAAKNLAVQMYSAAGFGESTADLAWDGHGLIAERGEMIAETERFALHGSAAVTDVDLVALREDRMRQTSFGENAGQHARPFRTVVAEPSEERRSAAVYRELHRAIAPLPFVPADPAKRDARCREIFLIKATSLARRLLALPEGGRRVAIGVSGGQDSTEALLVAAHALDLLGLPRTHIFGVTMPGFGTSRGTYENACALVRALGGRGDLQGRARGGKGAARRPRHADQPGASPPRPRRRDRPALGGADRPLRAARLLPLLLPALRLRPAAHRAHGAARLRRALRGGGHPALAPRLPRALLRQPVQARLRPRRPQSRLGRLPLPPRRLAHALRRVGGRLASRSQGDPREPRAPARGAARDARGQRPPHPLIAHARRGGVRGRGRRRRDLRRPACACGSSGGRVDRRSRAWPRTRERRRRPRPRPPPRRATHPPRNTISPCVGSYGDTA